MADLMSIARSGILAAQQQLNTTSNNIANIGTDGYSRQTVEQRSLDSERYGSSFVGSGTYVSDISRVYNEYAQKELTLSGSTYSEAATTYSKLSELDQILTDVGSAVPDSLNTVLDNLNNIVDMPMDVAVRENTLTSAEQLAASYQSLSSQLDGQVTQINEQIEGTIDRINAITEELGSINTALATVQGNDMTLLDQQDRLINELSEFVQVNVISQDNGVKSVMAGGSMMLVAGEESMQIGVTGGDPIHYETQLTGTTGDKTIVMPDADVGGQLQALMDYRDNDLSEARSQLDLMALGVADAFNKSQSQGFDLNGNVGQNMFTDINDSQQMVGRAAQYGDNTGSKQIGVEIGDVSQLSGDSYTLEFDGSNYSMTDESGDTITLTVDPNDPGKLNSEEGFSIRIDGQGTPAAGDKWELEPTRGAAGNLEVQLEEGESIAAAGYKLDTVSGDGSLNLVSVDRNDPSFPATGESFTIELDMTNGQFIHTDEAGNSTTYPLNADGNAEFNGILLEVDPSSADGDTFSLDLSFGPGDNSNALDMATIGDQKTMGDGSRTLHDVYQAMMTNNAGRANAAGVSAQSAAIVQQQAIDRVASDSGVNLDEEASDLIRHQQAYQASARVMTVAQETFDTLFNAVS
ncbi:flagellar hook-associated protein FlgK [Ferrimonas lipolytica]|uniref:Flagellar hook-associated protein 1 n=1 Tax=Ferrimonas lipolytica TaxID=2724191 RepID=A0A6H1UDX1_9GAMM|nr:flagellar hook-associated protein FlgK [Ferrimonas lipolytica]QIZ77244.1 flagellar hook-associated protein FlgK [Ferrimonas lipolytica]